MGTGGEMRTESDRGEGVAEDDGAKEKSGNVKRGMGPKTLVTQGRGNARPSRALYPVIAH